jgi:PAS domain-containing protein
MKPLITNHDEFDQILHCMGNGITVQDPTGKLVFVNKAAAAMMDCESPEAAIKLGGAAIFKRYTLFDEQGKTIGLADLPGRLALQGHEEPEIVVGFRLVGGTDTRWTTIKAMPVLDDAGKVAMAVNVLQDITSLKETEHRLREANERITNLLEQALLPGR